MTETRKAKIYKIINTIDDMVYIGSTIIALSHRMGAHRGRARKVEQFNCKLHRHMSTIGIEHFKIILIKDFDFVSKEDTEKMEFEEIAKMPKEKLLNENTVYKKRSKEHIRKLSDSQRGDKSVNWKYGSVFLRTGKSSDGFAIDCWCYAHKDDTNKQKRYQFSIKKYGNDKAQQMAKDKRREIFPEAPNEE